MLLRRLAQPRFGINGLQLHLQLANLLIKLRQKLFPVLILLPPTIRKETGKFFKKLLSLLTDLIPMDTKFTGKLGDDLFPFHGFQGYLGLEGCLMSSPHAMHRAIPPFRLWQANMHLTPLPSFWGVLYFPSRYQAFPT